MTDRYYADETEFPQTPPSGYGPPTMAPSAPLRRRRRFSGLAGQADTQMPQGQMVSGHYIPPSPLQSASAALSRGLGLADARSQGAERDQMQQTQVQEQAEDRYIKQWQFQAQQEQHQRATELRQKEQDLRERELQYRTDAERRRAEEFDRRQTYRENYRPPASRLRSKSRKTIPNVDNLIDKYYEE
jgi:hypothetical protein